MPESYFFKWLSKALLISLSATIVIASQAQRGTTQMVSVAKRPAPNGNSIPQGMTPDGRYVLFSSDASNLVPGDTNGFFDLFLHDSQTDTITRVSVGTNGLQGARNSLFGSMSGDGRLILFQSRSNNFVPNDTNNQDDIFLHDRETRQTICLSRQGFTGNPASGSRPFMSHNGQYAGFTFNPNPGTPLKHAYLYDLEHQTYHLMSKSSAGEPANGHGLMMEVSETGRYVLFASNATNLDSRATDGQFYLYLHDRDADGDEVFDQVGEGHTSTTLVSLTGELDALEPFSWTEENRAVGTMSSDGRVIVFPGEGSTLYVLDAARMEEMAVLNDYASSLPTMVAVSPDGRYVMYPRQEAVGVEPKLVDHDLLTGMKEVVSVTADGYETSVSVLDQQIFGARSSSSGPRKRCFPNTWRPNDRPMVSYHTNETTEVFARDMERKRTVGVSISIGTQGNGPSGIPAISHDGSRVAFATYATNLLAGDDNEFADILMAQVDTANPFTRIPTVGNGNSFHLALNMDGSAMVFASEASNFVVNDNNNQTDVFLWSNGNTKIVSRVPGGGPLGNQESVQPTISADSRYVAFTSLASNLVPNDTNEFSDVFLYDNSQDTLIRIQRQGIQPNNNSADPSLSGDGNFLAFVSDATNLMVGPDTNGKSDLFVYNTITGQITRMNIPNVGQPDGDIMNPKMNFDGRYVVFVSDATNLVPGDTNGKLDVFVWDRQTGEIERMSEDSFGRQGNGDSYGASISATGDLVAFVSESTNFMAGSTELGHLYAREKANRSLYGITGRNGLPADGPSHHAVISGDGQWVAFHSIAENLVDGDTMQVGDTFIHRIGCVPPGDVNGDGTVDDRDLLEVLFAFGTEGASLADVVVDQIVDDNDLLAVLFNFGETCSGGGGGANLRGWFGDGSDQFGEESDKEPEVRHTAEPFDYADYLRQVRELDMAHRGEWPYPVAGFGSEPYVSMYGDPLLWGDKKSGKEDNGFGNPFGGGDFNPAWYTYTFSQTKGVALGNSNINVYANGSLYIYFTCLAGGSGKAEAKGEAGINFFGISAKVAEAYALAEAANNSFKLNAYFKVAGTTLWSMTKNQNLSYSVNGTMGPWAINKQTSWTFYLGPVPIKVTAGFNASASATYKFFAGFAPCKVEAEFKPVVSSSAYIQAGLAFSFGCSASAGVGGSITLFHDTLTARATAHLTVWEDVCCIPVTFQIHNTINALSGSFYAYANACCWGLSGSKCGYLRRTGSWTHTIFSWPGYSNSGFLYNNTWTFCF